MLRFLLLTLVVAFSALAQNAALPPVIHAPFLDANGRPLSNGKLYFCTAGSTCPGNPLATYTDATGTTQNPNPVVLDATGYAPIWLGSGNYKVVAQNAFSSTLWTQDNVQNSGLLVMSLLGAPNGPAKLDSNGHVPQTELTYSLGISGSVNRSVQSRLQDAVSVKDFGATGDGSTNDTVAVQAALNSGYGAILFPAGTYDVCDLSLPSNISLYGVGSYNGSILSCSQSGHSIFTASVAEQDTFDGLVFKGAGVTAIKQTDLTQYFSTITIKHCHFFEELAYGLYGNFIYLHVDGSTFGYYGSSSTNFQAIYSKGVYTGNATNFNLIENSKFFHSTGAEAIYFEAGYGLVFRKDDFEQNSVTPLVIHGMSSIHVYNSWFEQNSAAQEMLFANDTSATIGNYVIDVEGSNFYPSASVTSLMSATGSAQFYFNYNDGTLSSQTVTNLYSTADSGVEQFVGNHLVGYSGKLVNGSQYATLNVPDTAVYPNVDEKLAPTGGAGSTVDEVLRGNYSFAQGTVLSSLALPTGSKWRLVFEGYWLDNSAGTNNAFNPAYIEVTSDSPTYTLPDGMSVTFSLNGSSQIIATSSNTAYTVYFRGTVHLTSSNSTVSPLFSMRLKSIVDANGFASNGTSGITITKTVKGSDGNNCSLTFTGGLLTTTNCP